MAKASVNLTCTKCGKEFTAEKKCYNSTEAANWEKYMTRVGGTCKTCWAEERRLAEASEKLSRQAKEYAEAQAWEYAAGILAELEGSEEQIAWATIIRYKILNKAIGGTGLKTAFFNENWEELIHDHGHGEETLSAIAYIRDWTLPLTKEKSAHWWIENRDISGLDAEYTLAHWGDIFNASLVKVARDEKIAEIKARKPIRPECLIKAFAESPEGSTWNCKVYGSARSNNLCIYIANKKFPLTKEEAAEVESYSTARDAWKKELEAVSK